MHQGRVTGVEAFRYENPNCSEVYWTLNCYFSFSSLPLKGFTKLVTGRKMTWFYSNIKHQWTITQLFCQTTVWKHKFITGQVPVSLQWVCLWLWGCFDFLFVRLCCILAPHHSSTAQIFEESFGENPFLQLLPAVGKCNSFSFPFNILNKHSLSSPWASFVCASIFGWQSCVHCSMSRSLSLSLLPLDVSVSLLSLLVTTCGLALFSVSLFVSWKLCWVPLSGRFFPDVLKGAHFLGGDQQPVLTEVSRKRCLPSKVDDLVQWASCSLLNDSDFLDVNIA